MSLYEGAVSDHILHLYKGVISDHTMRWVDLDTSLLFRNKPCIPISASTRQFTLSNAKTKNAFQDKLDKLHKHQRIPERIKETVSAFKVLNKAINTDTDFMAIVDKYQTLAEEVKSSIIAAADSAGRKDYGY